ncbi:MAG: hypothetical protein JTT15_05040 [Candidatus Brockarchaeota archaeon]|nr:hypothetical protein [Candidatus Brockarchaeota archaeon]
MIIEITNIIAGLILTASILPNIPLLGEDLAKLAKILGEFQTVIGIVAIILGILHLGLQGFVAIIAGLVLALGILPSMPLIGRDLAKLAKQLREFQTLIGVVAIVIGIWGLLV